MSEFRFSEAPEEPPPPKTKLEDRSYVEVPWLRQSGTNTRFIVVHVITLGWIPLILITSVVLLTGDIYFKEKTPDGKLKKWGFGNIVTFAIVFINVAFWITIFAWTLFW